MTRLDLVPELGVAAGSVAITAAIHWALLPWLGAKPPLVLFAAMAAALTFWRGFGPGMLASTMGTAVGGSLFIKPFGAEALQLEIAILFVGSLTICWMIYRLRVQQEMIEAAHQRRDHALAFVSHELRHPLANIQLAAAILQRDRSDVTRDRAAALIARSASRLGRVIDDLVDISTLRADAITIRFDDVVLQDVITASAEAASLGVSNRQQSLEVQVPDEPVRVRGDAIRLQQVFGNLLSNASRYSPEGAEITIALTADERSARIIVRDTGVGIKRDMLERIFEPFVRESGGTSDGLGIGLTLARTLVERHGGRIAADSAGPGRGSTFTVDLPRLPD
ncbi:MAG TPA: ATP-binding protein [Vicinamibacterales bacterium]|nr:ATP-binding protein [Vicinamibacterales bacterium]